MTLLPANLALTNIAPNAAILSADHRTNYSAIQAYANAMNALLAGGAAGDVLGGVGTTMTFAKPPGYRYDYAQIVANVTVNATTEGTATTVVAGNAVTYDGSTEVWLDFWAPAIAKGTTTISIEFFDGATSLGGLLGAATAAAYGFPMRKKLTPSAGAHTYTVKAWVDAGSGSVVAGAGTANTNLPAYLQILKA